MTTLRDYFVGQLSRADVNELIRLGRGARSILEFGGGGSTLLWKQFTDAQALCVDTDPNWIARTRSNLFGLVGNALDDGQIQFLAYERWVEGVVQNLLPRPRIWHDLIFVDGRDENRLEFARRAWLFLAPTGVMIFHDGRSKLGQDAFYGTLCNRMNEVERIDMCPNNSNLIVVHKCVDRVCLNDHVVERREPWETGFEPPPAGWGNKR